MVEEVVGGKVGGGDSGTERYLDFKRADGLIVCDGCGATYSDVLPICPQCKKGTVKEEDEPSSRFLCIQTEPCPVGGADGVCCLSCDLLKKCKRVCPTAKSYGDAQLGEGDILCEFMVKEKIKVDEKAEEEE